MRQGPPAPGAVTSLVSIRQRRCRALSNNTSSILLIPILLVMVINLAGLALFPDHTAPVVPFASSSRQSSRHPPRRVLLPQDHTPILTRGLNPHTQLPTRPRRHLLIVNTHRMRAPSINNPHRPSNLNKGARSRPVGHQSPLIDSILNPLALRAHPFQPHPANRRTSRRASVIHRAPTFSECRLSDQGFLRPIRSSSNRRRHLRPFSIKPTALRRRLHP